jgi:hypothetical protein
VQQKVERYLRLQAALHAFQQSIVAADAPADGSASQPDEEPEHDTLFQAGTGESDDIAAAAAAAGAQLQAGATHDAYLGSTVDDPWAEPATDVLPQLQQSAARAADPGPQLSADPWSCVSTEGAAASWQMHAAAQLEPGDLLQLYDTSKQDTDFAALLSNMQPDGSMHVLQARTPCAAVQQQEHEQQAQELAPSSTWPAELQPDHLQAQLLAGLSTGGCPPAGSSRAGAAAGPEQCAGAEEQPCVLTATEGAPPHVHTGSPADAGASVPQDSQQQPRQPQTRAVPSLSDAGQVASYADLCVSQLMQLYQRLAEHTQQQHTGLVVISWIAAVRASMTVFSSSSPQSVRVAVLHTCVHLVSLGANGGPSVSCLGESSPLFSRELLVPVVEGLMHTLLSLKMLCAEASTGQGHFSDMLESFRQQVQAGAAGSSVGEAVASLLVWL